ncbi:MAG: DNRLRE domain-containing protein [Pseudomonadota bacterium]
MHVSWKRVAIAAAFLVLPLSGWAQTTITLEPSRDTSLFAEPGLDLSNALGPHLYAGQTNNGDNRRALLAFDFSSIPVGSTINSATLTLTQSMAAPGSTVRTFTLHRVNGSWGEGTSNAGSPGGTGDSATAGDATWTERIFGSQSWLSPGGDFVATPSSTSDILSLGGPYDFTGLASDVQAWVGGSAVNDGWILLGEEDDIRTAYRFESRENPTATAVPQLAVTFTAPVTGGGGGAGSGNPTAVPGPGPAAIVLLILAMVLVSRRRF